MPAEEYAPIIAQLMEIPLFKNFPPATLERMAPRLRKEVKPRGTVLFKKGDPGDTLYIILSGQVSLWIPSDGNGGESLVGTLGEGEILGEMSLLMGESRHVTAKLDATTSFFVLEKEDFDAFMAKDPTMALHLSRLLSKRLAWTNESAAGLKAKGLISQPRLYFFLDLLDETRGPLFALNLAISLLEQTRRKVAILEFCVEQKSRFLHVLGQTKELPGAKDLKGLNLREIIHRLKQNHPSGLELFTVPAGLPTLYESDSIYRALNYLRSSYDFVLAFGSPLAWESLMPVLKESEFVYTVSLLDEPTLEPLTVKLNAHLNQFPQETNSAVRQVLLAPEGKDSFVARHKIRISWPRIVDKAFEEKRNPFEAVMGTKLQRSIDRLARILGNLKIGFALGAGGALGYSIAGVLKVLAREKIYPDIIAGTSIGAIAGALYAKGMTPEEIIEFGRSFDKKTMREIILWDLAWPKDGGFLVGIKLMRFLRGVFNDLRFEDLELPLTCVAGDILTGEEVLISNGPVLDAVRASTSVPVVFKPHKIGERYLVDGGVVNPVPTSVLVEMGADILISVQLTHSPAERSQAGGKIKAPGVLDVFFHSTLSMMHRIALSQQDLSHVNIHPQAPNYRWTDFERMDELMEIGEKAAEEALPKIKALLPFYSDSCATRLKV